MNNKEEALLYLESLINREKERKFSYQDKELNINKLRSFAEKINFSDKNHKIIHVAGTNGKGSIVLFLSQLLHSLNQESICYLSPHLVNINERILHNNTPIDDKLFIILCNKCKSIFADIKLIPSYFEMLNAMAVLLAHEKAIPYLILETGLGGRLDSTNFIENKLAILSSISLDHTHLLGNTLLEITREKAGIIYSNNPVIISRQKNEVILFLEDYCVKHNASFFKYGKSYSIKKMKRIENGFSFEYNGKDIKLDLKLELFSHLQCLNLSIALFAIEMLGIHFEQQIIQKAIEKFTLPGRFEPIYKKPETIIDAAHNPEALLKLSYQIRRYSKNYSKKILIFAMNADKDYKTSLTYLSNLFDIIIIQPLPYIIKGDISQDIYNYAKELNPSSYYEKSFYHSFSLAKDLADNNTLIIITGSYYLCGEAKEKITKL